MRTEDEDGDAEFSFSFSDEVETGDELVAAEEDRFLASEEMNFGWKVKGVEELSLWRLVGRTDI